MTVDPINGSSARLRRFPRTAPAFVRCWPQAINCDGAHTVSRSSLASFVRGVDDDTMSKVCWAVSYAQGCRHAQVGIEHHSRRPDVAAAVGKRENGDAFVPAEVEQVGVGRGHRGCGGAGRLSNDAVGEAHRPVLVVVMASPQ